MTKKKWKKIELKQRVNQWKTHLEPLIISNKEKSLIYASHIAWNVTDEAHAFRW